MDENTTSDESQPTGTGSDLDAELAESEAVRRYDELSRTLDELMESFPEAERPAAAAAVYFDADGTPRTRYRMLRSVPNQE